MTPAETSRLHELNDQIQVEKDRKKFLVLVTELVDLLRVKEVRLGAKVYQNPGNVDVRKDG